MTGEELRQARKAAGLSRRALASLTGLHPDTVKYWERRSHVDHRGHAPRLICAALGMRPVAPLCSTERMARGFLRSNARAWGGLLVGAKQKPRPERCGAKTRSGTPCRAKPLPGKTRCKFHGGMSTGPRTTEGRARIAEAQRRRWAEWRAGRDKSAFSG